MSNAIDSMEVLHFSPLILSPLFVAFYESLGAKNNSVLLSNLVLPLALYPESRQFLKNAKSTSTLRTFVSERERIFGLADRIETHRDVSTNAFQYGIDCGVLKIEKALSVEVTGPMNLKLTGRGDIARAASRLGILLSPFEVPAIYRMFGIKKI